MLVGLRRDSATMPELKPGVYPVVVHRFSLTATPFGIEMDDNWVVDVESEQVLHYEYIGGGSVTGISDVVSR